MKLELDFYKRDDVVKIAQNLLGQHLCVAYGSEVLVGKIVETEAYSYLEKACHAYNGRHTKRTSTMFEAGGIAYVYLCYGVHNLFNIVTHRKGVAEAVLIRAIEPVEGLSTMKLLRGVYDNDYKLTSGPGRLTKAMSIGMEDNKCSLVGNRIWLEYGKTEKSMIIPTPRIGVGYAGEDSLLPWRFYVKDNPFVSGKI